MKKKNFSLRRGSLLQRRASKADHARTRRSPDAGRLCLRRRTKKIICIQNAKPFVCALKNHGRANKLHYESRNFIFICGDWHLCLCDQAHAKKQKSQEEATDGCTRKQHVRKGGVTQT